MSPNTTDELHKNHELSDHLETLLRRRQVNRILHGFPSPRYWTPDAVDPSEELNRRQNEVEATPATFSLYAGVPYCIRTDPDRCGYCLFPVEVFQGTGQLDWYLDVFEKEGHFYKGHFDETVVDSVYIGGGTPNLMKPAQYIRMASIIQSVFPGITAATPITLEGIPQLFTLEKIQHMKAGGINRISMGIQQLNDDLNRLSGRRQSPKHVFNALDWAHAEGMEANVDVIFGWPQQTVKTMMEDLEQIVKTGVSHITHYELNVGGRTDFALNRRDELPSIEVTREMYYMARQFLLDNGYTQLTTYDFQKSTQTTGTVKDDEYTYEECVRDFGRRESLGWGFAGVSDFEGSDSDPGVIYRNRRRVLDYAKMVDAGEMPVEVGFRRSIHDLKLQKLFKAIQGFVVDRNLYTERFGTDPLADFEYEWRLLVEKGWCEISPERITLTEAGTYFVPTIQALLSRSRLMALSGSEATQARVAV